MKFGRLDWEAPPLGESFWPMRITEQTRYALRILSICAQRHPERIKVSELARLTGISPYNIFKLLQVVTKAGFLESSRGPKGGVAMTMPPGRLSVGQVIRQLEPRFQSCAPAEMISPTSPAQDEAERRVNEAIGRGISVFLAELDTIPIESILPEKVKKR